jgi:hypothetical protein
MGGSASQQISVPKSPSDEYLAASIACPRLAGTKAFNWSASVASKSIQSSGESSPLVGDDGEHAGAHEEPDVPERDELEGAGEYSWEETLLSSLRF